MKKIVKSILITVAILFVLVIGTIFPINFYVQRVGSQYIVSSGKAPEADAIIVLGAYVFPNGTVSTMLNDRLTIALELYENITKEEKLNYA